MHSELTPAYDRALTVRIAQGDQSACTEFYQLLQQGVRFYLLRHGAGDNIDDLVHEVFVRAISAIRTRSGPTRLPAYVLGIAKCVAADGLSDKIQARSNRPLRSHSVIENNTPELLRRERERRELLLAALAEMSERDREVLIRFYIKDQTAANICSAMDLTADQFRIIKSRAKQRLMNRMGHSLGHKRPTPMARVTETLGWHFKRSHAQQQAAK